MTPEGHGAGSAGRDNPPPRPSPTGGEGETTQIRADGRGTFTVRHGGRNYDAVRLVLLAPLTEPGALVSVRSADGEELALLSDLGALSEASRRALESAARERYLGARILKVTALEYQFGAVFWKVETDKGPREFVLQGISQHVRWLSEDRILISDVDGARFEIEDLSKLDEKSRSLVDLVLA